MNKSIVFLTLLTCCMGLLGMEERPHSNSTSSAFSSFANPYDVLGVTPQATSQQIKEAYKALSLKWHPDKNPAPEAAEYFKEIDKAYKSLTNYSHTYHHGFSKHTKADKEMPHAFWQPFQATGDFSRHVERGQQEHVGRIFILRDELKDYYKQIKKVSHKDFVEYIQAKTMLYSTHFVAAGSLVEGQEFKKAKKEFLEAIYHAAGIICQEGSQFPWYMWSLQKARGLCNWIIYHAKNDEDEQGVALREKVKSYKEELENQLLKLYQHPTYLKNIFRDKEKKLSASLLHEMFEILMKDRNRHGFTLASEQELHRSLAEHYYHENNTELGNYYSNLRCTTRGVGDSEAGESVGNTRECDFFLGKVSTSVHYFIELIRTNNHREQEFKQRFQETVHELWSTYQTLYPLSSDKQKSILYDILWLVRALHEAKLFAAEYIEIIHVCQMMFQHNQALMQENSDPIRMYLDDAILNECNRVKEQYTKKTLLEVKHDLITVHHDYFAVNLALQLEEQSLINGLSSVVSIYLDVMKNLQLHGYHEDAGDVIDKLLSILTKYTQKLTNELKDVKSALEASRNNNSGFMSRNK